MGLTNVQRVVFDLSGAALPYSQSIGTVAVGDVVLFQVLNRTSTGCNFSGQITDSGAGNNLQQITFIDDGTRGRTELWGCICTAAGTMVINIGAGSAPYAGFDHIFIEIGQWSTSGGTAAIATHSELAIPFTSFTSLSGNSLTFALDGIVAAFFGGVGIGNDVPTPDSGWTLTNHGAPNQAVCMVDKDVVAADSPVTPHIQFGGGAFEYGNCLAVMVSFTASGGSATPDEDDPAPPRAPSRSWAAAALALAALSGGVDELPPQAAATIVEDVPAYASPPPLLAARAAPTVAPDESWFASAYDDEAILCPYRCVGPVAQQQRTIAAQAAAYQQGPHEDLWFQSTPDDAPTSTWAPPPVAWLYAEEASTGLSAAADELPVTTTSIVDDLPTWQPAPPPYVLLFAEEASQVYAPTDESWFASAVDDEAVLCPLRCGGPLGIQRTAAAAQAAASMQSLGEEWPTPPPTAIVDDDPGFVPPPPPALLLFAEEASQGQTAPDDSWFASAVDEGPLSWPPPPYPLPAPGLVAPFDEWMPQPGIFGLDDEATQPVTPPRFDLPSFGRAAATIPTFVDELYFQSTPDDTEPGAYPPPPNLLLYAEESAAAFAPAVDDVPSIVDEDSSWPPPPPSRRVAVVSGAHEEAPFGVVDDDTGAWFRPAAARVPVAAATAVDEFVGTLPVDDEVVQPVTPPRFDVLAARASAAAWANADELFFAGIVDDDPTQLQPPPPQWTVRIGRAPDDSAAGLFRGAPRPLCGHLSERSEVTVEFAEWAEGNTLLREWPDAVATVTEGEAVSAVLTERRC